MGRLFVIAGQPAIARDVGIEYRRQFARQLFLYNDVTPVLLNWVGGWILIRILHFIYHLSSSDGNGGGHRGLLIDLKALRVADWQIRARSVTAAPGLLQQQGSFEAGLDHDECLVLDVEQSLDLGPPSQCDTQE